MNLLVIALTALIPTLVGFIWYHPKVMGTQWMHASKLTEDDLKGANMLLIMGLSLLFSFMLAFSLQLSVIHQMHVYSLFADIPKAEADAVLVPFMEKYGQLYRSFGHGALHGGITAIFLVMPVLATNAMFERKGWKYILVNTAYWFITLMLMGGVLCQFIK
jgi:hypothetical protein